MNITIISVGKIKEKYLRDAVNYYTQRLSKCSSLQIIELPDEKTPDNASLKDEIKIKEKEGSNILRNIKADMYVIALDLKGVMLSSKELSNYINKLQINGNNNLSFIIGGSLGLSSEVLKRADYSLCFSKMTFPHQLFKVILLEQICRNFRASN
ncbi:23S rRNA (pseudouridine(1915)-N(3))-methyltransferase RlmH [Clostridium sp. JN-9]|uniref:23S rRNA (pseudouridine(1915)-N(3))-methyltransferase RlmH n=1 Tax=Clostridium sp. JN-9 TaxID=2507159 RepID=UPI000FFE0D58|nr:23S rRNA (pseudouridine(1915)-N(3))-methyltransferase RlmH [Clostridium sp. JN-9]QAT41494.1 23S rRNA (pseudouridine(1915)-N(3))-methyltransferase RlmH [Clostridium sp. JN-9]